jgi:hypothetical protein
VLPSSKQFNWKSSLPLPVPEMKSLGKTTEYYLDGNRTACNSNGVRNATNHAGLLGNFI